MQDPYIIYKDHLQKIADIKYASAVLQWDQETYLPPAGNEIRGRQLATLNEVAHSMFSSESTGKIIRDALSSGDLSPEQRRNAQLSLEDYERAVKLSPAFVRKMSEVVNRSFHSWIEAREKNDFKIFEAPLQNVIEVKREEAEQLGYEKHPYDALMNDYDKGLTSEKVDRLFTDLRPQLKTLLDNISQKPQVDDTFLRGNFEKNKQWDLGVELLKKIHFDFGSGRQDISEHPFSTSFNAGDVRLTTRVDENDFANMTWSCLHEGGHGLYEQGLPKDQYGLPLGEYCSLSIHESQSRLWENCVGRSFPFWTANLPIVKKYFPTQFETIDTEKFYKAINKVEPSLIRTEADELTYHFHVMIRYELEKKLIGRELEAADIPAYWNEQYQKYLGIKVPDDKRGCLQDVHWSHGSFGYFATYSIGSLYAAQFYNTIRKSHPHLDENLHEENTTAIWAWLKQHIYAFGRYYLSEDLCTLATGEPLNASHFIAYAKEKYSDIYL